MEDPEMAKKSETVQLAFVGTPGDFIHGYAPADIEVTAAEADELVATKLYVRKNEKAAAAAEEATP